MIASIHRSRLVASSAALALLALLAACGSPPAPNPTGYVPEDVRDVDDPATAIAQRLAEAGPLLEALAAGGEAASGADERIESLAREVAALASHERFDPWPATRARLRTRILFLDDDDAKTRRAALDDCRSLFKSLQKNLERGGRP